MALCRIYQRVDGTVAVIVPNEKLRLKGESEPAFVARICAVDAVKSGLDGLPFKDVNQNALPSRADRKHWKLRGNAVMVEKP